MSCWKPGSKPSFLEPSFKKTFFLFPCMYAYIEIYIHVYAHAHIYIYVVYCLFSYFLTMSMNYCKNNLWSYSGSYVKHRCFPKDIFKASKYARLLESIGYTPACTKCLCQRNSSYTHDMFLDPQKSPVYMPKTNQVKPMVAGPSWSGNLRRSRLPILASKMLWTWCSWSRTWMGMERVKMLASHRPPSGLAFVTRLCGGCRSRHRLLWVGSLTLALELKMGPYGSLQLPLEKGDLWFQPGPFDLRIGKFKWIPMNLFWKSSASHASVSSTGNFKWTPWSVWGRELVWTGKVWCIEVICRKSYIILSTLFCQQSSKWNLKLSRKCQMVW